MNSHILRNKAGVEVQILSLGCVIQRLLVPDRYGNVADIVLGFDNSSEYLGEKNPYFGAVVGRCANRIANAEFTLDGVTYQLAANNGKASLHGGLKGWDKHEWSLSAADHPKGQAVRLTRTSHDGEENYPGNVQAAVTYVLTEGNALIVEMEATSDRATLVNMAQHSYFNLAGHGSGDVLRHEVMLNADSMTPVDSDLIPTGEIASVKDTPFDFVTPHQIGSRIKEVPGGGYDHNLVINAAAHPNELKQAAAVVEPRSGRVLTVHTTAPGLQFYSGNFLDGIHGKDGAVYHKHGALCLETQGFPDAIHHQDSFPSVILRPNEKYKQITVYAFSVQE